MERVPSILSEMSCLYVAEKSQMQEMVALKMSFWVIF